MSPPSAKVEATRGPIEAQGTSAVIKHVQNKAIIRASALSAFLHAIAARSNELESVGEENER